MFIKTAICILTPEPWILFTSLNLVTLENVMVHLIAVQAAMRLEHYQSAAHFKAKILQLTEAAVAGLGPAPKLIAFPETIGFPLLLTLGHFDAVREMTRVSEAALYLAKCYWPDLLRLAWQRRLLSPALLYHLRAVPAFLAYREAFAEAARQSGATVVAGSSFLPAVDEEAARGVHITGQKVYNSAFTFSPYGRLLDRTHKCFLTPGAEARSGLSPASLDHVHAFETPLGRVGVSICLDGFFTSIIDQLDGLGTQIVVQPSANHASWQRPWPHDPKLTEGEAWLEHGLRAQLQNRLHLRYGVNPMLVGEVFELRPRGRSSLIANTRFQPVSREGYQGLLAIAKTDDQEEIVRAQVELDS